MAALLTLHGANRMLERSIPVEVVEICRLAAPLLNHKPLRFRWGDYIIVAIRQRDVPRIISVWRAANDGLEQRRS
ncbi:hypothetical protein [Geoalkalibacter halelectricus]|uniref:Uncharacterized protein n=1 Tax=Geoalkalibacter halelectricus TaxID=2847045 RepID=A0ABY5ZNX2_9BACT|nr:hypothetical protein [Geoalkalibacter halelectricus]MDO3377150.1 hypothetical protein [Geoalkalibacter halelectricus]UWZ79657.1 hypothetical protein L9S41_18545 [Geoalkalibacter halelectricus]